jgi:NADH-quinone oxidoreductase subunit G
MPQITINGTKVEFTPGEVILKAANRARDTQAASTDIPQYCYHDGLSIVASCRICLGEIWMPDPKTGKLTPHMGGKLMPTCQTACAEGMVVYTDSPKAVANQKSVMEYLLINHPLDCPVCDQAGECLLQDYSYEFGRGQSRFEETKVKNPKKDLGPHVYLYADRCIMCTRCVRFTREVSGTSELLVAGRGNREEIDVFPGQPLDNELSGNVVDLCPVGALLDKDFLFAQRVWFLKETPSVDGLTASGDNISVHHNDGKVYRVKPRVNMSANKWWISDEVRFGWKFVQGESRLRAGPKRRQFGVSVETDWPRALRESVEGLVRVAKSGKRVAALVSPMLSCEDAFHLGQAALAIDPKAFLAVGPIPVHGQDKTFPPGKSDGFKVFAEKAPNARGVRRVLAALSARSAHNGYVASFEQFVAQVRSGEIGGVIVTGNYPSAWMTRELMDALGSSGSGTFVVAVDTMSNALTERADVLLPSLTWLEKSGTFQSARDALQGFEQAIGGVEGARSEAQIGLDLLATLGGQQAPMYNVAFSRQAMAAFADDLGAMVRQVALPVASVQQQPDMEMVTL